MSAASIPNPDNFAADPSAGASVPNDRQQSESGAPRALSEEALDEALSEEVGRTAGELAEKFERKPGEVTPLLMRRLLKGKAWHTPGREHTRLWFRGPKPKKPANDNDGGSADKQSAPPGEPRRLTGSADLAQHAIELGLASGEFTEAQLREFGEGSASALVAYARQLTVIRLTRASMYMLALPRPNAVGRDYHVYVRDALTDGVFVDLGATDDLVSLYTDKGKARPLHEINKRISTPALKGYQLHGTTAVSHLGKDSVFYLKTWEERPICPQYHLQSDLYFYARGAEARAILYDFTVCTKRDLLGQPCVFLVIRGATRDGKSLIADGLGAFYRAAGAVPGSQVIGTFNKFFSEGPIVHFPEEFPSDHQGRVIGDGALKELISTGVHTVADKFVPAVPLIGCGRYIMTTNNRDIYSPPHRLEPDACEALAIRFAVAETPQIALSPEEIVAAAAGDAALKAKIEANEAAKAAERVAAAARVSASAAATARATRQPTPQEIADAVALGPRAYLAALGGRPFTDPSWIKGEGLFTAHLKWVQQNHVIPPDRRADSFFLKSNAEISGLKQTLRRRTVDRSQPRAQRSEGGAK